MGAILAVWGAAALHLAADRVLCIASGGCRGERDAGEGKYEDSDEDKEENEEEEEEEDNKEENYGENGNDYKNGEGNNDNDDKDDNTKDDKNNDNDDTNNDNDGGEDNTPADSYTYYVGEDGNKIKYTTKYTTKTITKHNPRLARPKAYIGWPANAIRDTKSRIRVYRGPRPQGALPKGYKIFRKMTGTRHGFPKWW